MQSVVYQNNAYIKVEKSTAAQYDKLICNIGQLITSARDKVAVEVNTTLLDTYWEIGRYIVEFEQNGNARAEYGKGLLKQLAHDLTLSYGAGFNHFNLVYMRKLYQTFEKSRTLSYKLSWSHYTEILKINDEFERVLLWRLMRGGCNIASNASSLVSSYPSYMQL